MKRSTYSPRFVPIHHRRGGLRMRSHQRLPKKSIFPLRMDLDKKIISIYNSHQVPLTERQIHASWVHQVVGPLSVCVLLTPHALVQRCPTLTMLDIFRKKVEESGKQCPAISTDTFFGSNKTRSAQSTISDDHQAKHNLTKAPPRLLSDQLINVFFQEWAPLFPILHRPTFLNIYTNYVADPERCEDQNSVAQLNLLFCVAAQSMDVRLYHSLRQRNMVADLHRQGNRPHMESFERQWRGALEAVLTENTLATLQCLALAQLYCIAKADYTNLQHYKTLAFNLSHHLSLHYSQDRLTLDTLTIETRKKVFWTLYAVDW